MRDLIGIVPRDTLYVITESTRLRFADILQFRTAEALLLYEQRVLPEDQLFDLCQSEYDEELYPVEEQYIPVEILNHFANTSGVPVCINNAANEIIVGILPEIPVGVFTYESYNIITKYITIYDYVRLHSKYWGEPKFLHAVPVSDKLMFIIAEAVELGAADITITNVYEGSRVYYNVRKKKVNSRRALTRNDVESIALLMCDRAGHSMDRIATEPIYIANRLDEHHRGRICINRNFYGVAISIRVLSDDPLKMGLADLNLAKTTVDFVNEYVLDRTPGLRLWIGETMSGKNTSICCALSILAQEDSCKIVSVEQPVETPIPNVEQLEVSTEEEFAQVTGSLVRQNPDVVYIVEMNHMTALDTIKVANTSKIVFSTIHANSIADTISRIMDLTGLSVDRVIMSLHTCIYQKLIRNEEEDKLYPQTRCVFFSEAFKQRLYEKPLSEVQQIIREEEMSWH